MNRTAHAANIARLLVMRDTLRDMAGTYEDAGVYTLAYEIQPAWEAVEVALFEAESVRSIWEPLV